MASLITNGVYTHNFINIVHGFMNSRICSNGRKQIMELKLFTSLKGQCDGRRPFKFCCDFTACEIITSSNLSISLSVFLQYGTWWRVCR